MSFDREALHEQFIIERNDQMSIRPKLKTYVNFQDSLNLEIYVKQTLFRSFEPFFPHEMLNINWQCFIFDMRLSRNNKKVFRI